ncbi:MAG TPA: ABC transporter ATP-binding protein, partial [Ignavibacteria bacterium]|nr:ABC transporter ATP-binding protein [Ignavibacteria bacterium]
MSNDYQKDEEILGKAYDSKLMKRLLSYIKPYRKHIIIVIIINIIVAALGPVRPILTKIAIDKYIANSDYHGLLIIGLLLLATLLLQAVIQYFLTYFMQYLGQKIIYDLRSQLYTHIQKLALKFFDKTPIGRMVTRVT